MALTTKMTFALDNATVAKLNDAASRLGAPKSGIVREAILEFHDRIGHLSERERVRMLRTFDEMVPNIPERSEADVDLELAEVRLSRNTGGRQNPAG
jgi:hypothetical protein